MHRTIPDSPSILTTTVGSYPVPSWLPVMPSEQSLIDATRVVLSIQENAGIDLPTDGELYRFDVNHPDTNGMIDYFVRPMEGITSAFGRPASLEFRQQSGMGFRSKPAGIVQAALGEGTLDLPADCRRLAGLTGKPFKFTLTSPYMLARTLLDHHYRDFAQLVIALADVLAAQAADLCCSCLQVDEANLTGHPEDAQLAACAINRILDAAKCERAVHLCFGNYGGQIIQSGTWARLIEFLNGLHVDHLVLEVAHRPADEIKVLRQLDGRIRIGAGVIDVKVNSVETPDHVASRIASLEQILGPNRLRWVHPDCGFWMLNRSVADRKIEALVRGRDLYLGA